MLEYAFRGSLLADKKRPELLWANRRFRLRIDLSAGTLRAALGAQIDGERISA